MSIEKEENLKEWVDNEVRKRDGIVTDMESVKKLIKTAVLHGESSCLLKFQDSDTLSLIEGKLTRQGFEVSEITDLSFNIYW